MICRQQKLIERANRSRGHAMISLSTDDFNFFCRKKVERGKQLRRPLCTFHNISRRVKTIYTRCVCGLRYFYETSAFLNIVVVSFCHYS